MAHRFLAQFDPGIDGFYLVKSCSAGKCLACGEVIPLGWREYPDNRQWLRLHWAGRLASHNPATNESSAAVQFNGGGWVAPSSH